MMTIIKQFCTQRLTGIFSFQRFQRFYSAFLKNYSREKSLNVTDSALNQLKILKQKFPEKSLRVAVEAGGCHGFQCKFSLNPKTELNESDNVFDPIGLQVICDNISWSMIKDAKLDYQKELIGSSFRIIDNPLADSGCGCGVSFDLKSNKN